MEEGLSTALDARKAATSQLAHVLLEQLEYQPLASSSSSKDCQNHCYGSASSSSSSCSWACLNQPNWAALPDKLLLFCMALMHKAGLTTYYGQYAALQHEVNCDAEAVQKLAMQLRSSLVVQNMLRFGSGLGSGLATAAAQIELLDDQLAAAAARVWAAGKLHQLTARWLRVMSRIPPHIVLCLLHNYQCLPRGICVQHSWQLPMAIHDVAAGQQQQLPAVEQWSPAAAAARWAAAAAAAAAAAKGQSAAACEAASELEAVPWLSTCIGDGRGGWQCLTAVGAGEEGRRDEALHLLPCLRRGQREGALVAVA
jgi:hypothetical protein